MAKKVLHVIIGLNDGGAEGVLARLCLYDRPDLEHVVVSLGDEGKYGPLLSAGGVKVHCLRMKGRLPNPLKVWSLVRLMRREQPDVVQTWMYHADLIGGTAARLAGIRHVFWGVRMSSLEPGRSSKMTRMVAKVCARLSGAIPEKIICCANKARAVHEAAGYRQEKLVVIQNGYDLSKYYADPEKREAIRREFGIKNDEFLLGMVARFDPLKDHRNLLEALALLKQKTSFKCLLIGKGLRENSGIAADIRRWGLGEHILLTGARADIPAIMNALDLHVLSSSSEGFPNVLAEAMACGTPAVSTDVGDALDILGDERLVCPSRHAGALAELLASQKAEWSKTEDWARRKVACAERIGHFFSIRGMVDGYVSTWFPQKKLN